ncbi:MAG: hypothetical protein NVS1B7_6160 [Candidatus Saccharimonadales bacterium]
MKNVQPLDENNIAHVENNAAVALIRAKLHAAYQNEPSASEEIAEVQHSDRSLSKHQQYIQQLNSSGKSLAEIQTAWHEYYSGLSDQEKHEVWHEFYREHEKASHYVQATKHDPDKKPEPGAQHVAKNDPPTRLPHNTHVDPVSKESDGRTQDDLKRQIVAKVQRRASKCQLNRKDHFKSLGFGLSMGFVVIFVLMFTFFNERFITPFITPSTRVSATPIIVDPINNTVGPAPEVIIPKINVEIPVLYNVASIDESAIQQGLAESVVHYPTTPSPGEVGNGVIFGHSSSNIFNKSKYKFAFLQLRELTEGDTFYINKGGRQYVYKVIAKRVVPPTEVSVLNDTLGRPATFTLITCDPPGLNVNRLVVTGEQISPVPAANKPSTAKPLPNEKPAILPGNAESLWHRLTSWLIK